MKDYHETKTVDLVRVQSKSGEKVMVISETLSYQSHVPYQALLLSMRVSWILDKIA